MGKRSLLKKTGAGKGGDASLSDMAALEMEAQELLEASALEDKAIEMMTRKASLEEAAAGRMIADAYRLRGRIETARFFNEMSSLGMHKWLLKAKSEKVWKAMPDVSNWAEFLGLFGLNRRTTDEKLKNLETLGDDFWLTAELLEVGIRQQNKLRLAVTNGELSIEDGVLQVGDKSVELSPENKDEVAEVIDQYVRKKDAEIAAAKREAEDREKAVQAQKKITEALEKEIVSQDAKINKLEAAMNEVDGPVEDRALFKKLETGKATVEGIMMRHRPVLLGTNPDQRAVAAYFAFIEYLTQRAISLRHEAEEMFGRMGAVPAPNLDHTMPTGESE